MSFRVKFSSNVLIVNIPKPVAFFIFFYLFCFQHITTSSSVCSENFSFSSAYLSLVYLWTSSKSVSFSKVIKQNPLLKYFVFFPLNFALVFSIWNMPNVILFKIMISNIVSFLIITYGCIPGLIVKDIIVLS